MHPKTDGETRRARRMTLLASLALAACLAGMPAQEARAVQGDDPAGLQAVVETGDDAQVGEAESAAEGAEAAEDAAIAPEQAGEPEAGQDAASTPEAAPSGAADAEEAPVEEADATPDGESAPAGDVPGTAVVDDVAPEPEPEPAPTEPEAALVPQAPGTPDAPAGAVEVADDTYVMQSKVAADRVMQAAGESPAVGARVASAAYTGDKNQQWVARREGESLWYRLYVRGSNYQRALGVVDDGKGNPSVVVVDVSATEVKSLLSLLWSFVAVDGASYRVVNAAWEGMCLGVDGSKAAAAISLQEQKATAPKAQRFALFARNPQVGPSSANVGGAYVLSLSGTTLAVDIAGGKAGSGANAQVGTRSSSRTQRIYLERDAEGYYTAWVIGTGKVLESAGDSVISGDNVRQWDYKGYERQRWSLVEQVAADGSITYLLQNKKTGLYLGAASPKDGANLCGLGAGEAQRAFALAPVALMDKGIYLVRPSSASKLAVQVRNASTKTAGLLLATASGALSQKFELVPVAGADLWRIRTGSSGGWLTWTGGSKVVQSGNGRTAATASNTWRAVWVNGGVSFVNVASEAAGAPRALDTSQGKAAKGTGIVANRSTGAASQHLVFEPTQLLGEGYYFLRSAGGRYLQVKGTSAKNRADIRVAGLTGGMGQFFRIEFKDGYTRIANIFSQKYLQAAKAKSGANVAQRKGGRSRLQLWQSVIQDGGRVAFVNVADPRLVLGAAKGGRKAGANVRVERLKSGKGQLWRPVALKDSVLTQRTSRQKSVVRSAKRTPSPGYGLCAAWITYLFENAGLGTWGGDACDQYRLWCKSANLNKLRPGMIVAVSTHSHTPAGRIWGHVCVYVGNGKIMDNAGYIRTMSLYDWLAWYGDRVTPKWGWLGGRRLA